MKQGPTKCDGVLHRFAPRYLLNHFGRNLSEELHPLKTFPVLQRSCLAWQWHDASQKHRKAELIMAPLPHLCMLVACLTAWKEPNKRIYFNSWHFGKERSSRAVLWAPRLERWTATSAPKSTNPILFFPYSSLPFLLERCFISQMTAWTWCSDWWN